MNTAQETPSETALQPENSSQEWLTYPEAAAILGCSTKTLQRRVKAQEIAPYLRHGSRHWWFKPEDIARLLIGV
jgi:excisionase family DNA binding protein